MTRILTVDLLPLHDAQRAIFECPARFRVACCGRRFGKGVEAVNEELSAALRGGNVWHIAPAYPDAAIHWRLLRYVAQQIPGVTVREADMMVQTRQRGYVQIKSANSGLRGEGLDLVAVDEAAHIADLDVIWHEALRPALSDRQGRAVFYSTPNGLNAFYDLFTLGLDPSERDWVAFHYPTAANPHIAASEIEAARTSLPDRVFRQEYLAEFVEDGAGVFRFVRDVSILQPQDGPLEGHRYLFGVDWGRSDDFTVVSILDTTTRQQAALDRFTGIGWALQRQRLKTLYERWRPDEIYAEENSIGGPNIEALQREGLPVRPFVTTAQSKAALIDALALAIEKGAAHEDGGVLLLDDPVQRAELQAYAFERLPSGVYRYSAPPGKHDDTVISLALAVKHTVPRLMWLPVVLEW